MAEEKRISSWSELFLRTVELGLGAATLTAETTQKMVNDLVGMGQVSKEEGATLIDKLIATGHEQREQMATMIEKATERALARMDLARRSEVEALRTRVAELERQVMGAPVDTEPITPIDKGMEDYNLDQE